MSTTYTIKHKEYYHNNKEKCTKSMKKYRLKNREKLRLYMVNYNEKNRTKINTFMREYYYTHKKERKLYRKQSRELYRTYYQNKRKEDTNYRLVSNLRRRLREALKGKRKELSSAKFLGCSIKIFKQYLQHKFTKKMSWDNYGIYWEIDHITPCASFDLSKVLEQKKCFHYNNLQPLTIKDNRSKSNRR